MFLSVYTVTLNILTIKILSIIVWQDASVLSLRHIVNFIPDSICAKSPMVYIEICMFCSRHNIFILYSAVLWVFDFPFPSHSQSGLIRSLNNSVNSANIYADLRETSSLIYCVSNKQNREDMAPQETPYISVWKTFWVMFYIFNGSFICPPNIVECLSSFLSWHFIRIKELNSMIKNFYS